MIVDRISKEKFIMSDIKEFFSNSKPYGIKSPRAWFRLILSIVLSVVIMFSQMLGMTLASSLSLPPLFMTAVGEVVPLILATLVVIAFGGRKWLGIDGDSVKYAFKVGWVFVALGLVASIMSVISSARKGVGLADGFLMNLVGVTLTCLLIGFFEEIFYRGINFGCLLGVFGGSKIKIMIAVLFAAWGFGRAHVASLNFGDLSMFTQAILKIIQTGMLGVVMCDIMMHTKKIGAAGLLHAANDFMLMVTGALFEGKSVCGQYVVSDSSTGGMVIITYLIMIAVYLYPTICSVRRIWNEYNSCYGPYVQTGKEINQ